MNGILVQGPKTILAKSSGTKSGLIPSLIDNYTTKNYSSANGLLMHGTYSKPGNNGIDEMTSWGDYFYMEALHRMLDPEWELYW